MFFFGGCREKVKGVVVKSYDEDVWTEEVKGVVGGCDAVVW